MNAVLYFSCSGQSCAAARKISKRLGFPLIELKRDMTARFELAVVIFPVHCQGLPAPLKGILKNITAERVALVATYGGQSAGNALYEAAKHFDCIVAAACLPAKHTYSDMPCDMPELPDGFYLKLSSDTPVEIPKRKKTPFAGFLPAFRSRRLIKLKVNADCDGCGICTENCPAGAIDGGRINCRCIRCLKCVNVCPKGAISARQGKILKAYLKKRRCDEIILYV